MQTKSDRYNLRQKTVLVVDFGGYNEVAIKLAESFGTVLYFIDCKEPFPKHNKKIIGKGIPNIEVIHNIEDYEHDVDLWYFCDLFYGALADKLRNDGKIVFGAGKGEELELDRKAFKELMTSLDMPVNEYESIVGISSLREYLKEHENVYVKLNADMRGELESSHCENYNLFKPVLDSLQHTLGFDAEDAEFLVEQPISPAIEYGFDSFTVDGRYPTKNIFGIEIKDSSFACCVTDYDKLPEPVIKYNLKLSAILESYNYRGHIGNEIRHQIGGDAYLLDIYCRLPQPPTSLMIRMINNYADVVWDIARGIVPELEFKYKYGAQLIIKSDWAKTEPQAIYFPEELIDNISIKNLAIKDGTYYYIPQVGCEMEEIGAVVAMSDTLQGAISKCKEVAEQVKGFGIKINADALDDAQEELEKLSQVGVNLFKQTY